MRPAQRVVEDLDDFAVSGRSLFRKVIGIDDVSDMTFSFLPVPGSGLNPNAAVLALPAQVVVGAFEDRGLEAIWGLKFKIK